MEKGKYNILIFKLYYIIQGIYRQPHRETQAIHREVEVEEVCIKILARCTKT